jgi:hypothetical protein
MCFFRDIAMGKGSSGQACKVAISDDAVRQLCNIASLTPEFSF